MTEVKVRNKENGNIQTITYQAYKDVQYLFELIGQVDSKGNLIEGDPNLLPQHQRKSVSVIVADAGQQSKPKFDSSNIPDHLREQFELKKAELEAKNKETTELVEKEPVEVVEPTPVKTKRPYNKRIKES